jgi:DNA-binding LytR/AlgR family response regulator
MQKLKVLIVEDNKASVECYLDILSTMKEDVIYPPTIAATFMEAFNLITTGNRYNITFMDYLLDDNKTAGDLIEETEEYHLHYGRVVYATVNLEEGRRLRQQKVLSNYLQLKKPFTALSLKKILNKVRQDLGDLNENRPRPLSVKLRDKQIRVIKNIYDILFVYGSGDESTYVIYEDGKIVAIPDVVDSIGKQMEILGDSTVFLEVHRSYIVNTLKVKRLKQDSKRGGWLSFTDKLIGKKGPDKYTARFSLTHENKTELFRILALKNIHFEDNSR